MIQRDLLWKSLVPLLLLVLLLLTMSHARGQESEPSAATTTPGLARLREALVSGAEARYVFSYPTRPGVHGDGDRVLRWDRDSEYARWWECDCTEGPARVELRIRDGAVHGLRVRVGGTVVARNGVTDLGVQSSTLAADFLMEMAEGARGSVAEDAVFAAVIADGYRDWDRLLRLARDQERPRIVREAAVFWLGQAAGEAATAGLKKLLEDDDEDLELREHAIFALSQRPSEEAVPALSEVARHIQHPQLRRSAFFWLAQHDEDPRVLALFESILSP